MNLNQCFMYHNESTITCLLQGVVTAATSLITTLAQKNPEEFKTSVSLAVSRLSRVIVHFLTLLKSPTLKGQTSHYLVPYV